MHLSHYLDLVHRSELALADAYLEVAAAHGDEPDIAILCRKLAKQCDHHAERVFPFIDRYHDDAPREPERLHSDLFGGTRSGGLGLLRDLHDLFLMVAEVELAWTIVLQGAQGARDRALVETVTSCGGETEIQRRWLLTRIKQAAPEALLVAA